MPLSHLQLYNFVYFCTLYGLVLAQVWILLLSNDNKMVEPPKFSRTFRDFESNFEPPLVGESIRRPRASTSRGRVAASSVSVNAESAFFIPEGAYTHFSSF